MAGRDKRLDDRKHSVFLFETHDLDNPNFQGHVVDISMDGLMLITREEIGPGREFRFEIVLPEEMEGRDRINCRAISRWCREDVNPDYFAVGFEIKGIDSIDERLILDLIQEYSF